MDTSDIFRCIVLIVLLYLSSYFSSAETALTTVNRVRLKELLEAGDKKAEKVLLLLDKPEKMLSTVLICNNVVNLSASALTTATVAKIFGSVYIAFATGALTLLLLIFGEITPKTMATLNNEKLSLRCGGTILTLSKILTPVIFIVDKMSNTVLRLYRVDPASAKSAMTEFEFRSIIEESVKDGVLESEEKEIINNVVDFGDSTARDIMIPKASITFIDVNTSFDELKEIFLEEKHTRFPVFEESTDNVIGIVNMKDLLFYENWDGFSIRSIMREPYFTYEYKKTSDLLAEMRQKSQPMSIVLDEYGAAAGLVTIEDLLEEIVGEIRDEYDDYEEEFIVKLEEGRFLVDGSMKIDDVNDALDTDYDSEDFDSIGGLVIERLEEIPKEGDFVILEDGDKITVVDMDKNHIDKVEIVLASPANLKGEEDMPEEEAVDASQVISE